MKIFDSSAWSPELRRALNSARPDFFGLPPDQQLTYRVKLPGIDRQAIVAALLAARGHRQRQTGTFLNDDPGPEGGDDEQRLRIVFSDPSALAQVRFPSFLSDCRALQHPAEELILVERREADRVVCFVNEQYEELLRTFDANVVPLRRQIKVLIYPGAFDALNSDKDR